MANLNDIKLSAQDILKKQFRSKVKGYDPDEVDAYLDQVISDYETFQQLIEDLYGQIGTLQRQLMDEKQKKRRQLQLNEKTKKSLRLIHQVIADQQLFLILLKKTKAKEKSQPIWQLFKEFLLWKEKFIILSNMCMA